MHLLIEYLNQATTGYSSVPTEQVKALDDFLKSRPNSDQARTKLDHLLANVMEYNLEEDYFIALATLAEKTRQSDLLDLWLKAFLAFPLNTLACRMCMRWYFRKSDVESGLHLLIQETPDRGRDKHQTELALLGLAELQLYTEIDQLMQTYLGSQRSQGLMNRYIMILDKQGRYKDALAVASTVADESRFSAKMLDVLSKIKEKIASNEKVLTKRADALGDIAALFIDREVKHSSQSGKACFFTGQLGSGGAERQMSRIASELKVNPGSTGVPPLVCVRHAKPELKSDFFLPVLQEAGVEVVQLNDLPDEAAEISCHHQDIQTLLNETQDGIKDAILKLCTVLRANEVESLYVWQDGAVVIGVIAGLLAEVPNIVCNFRGMPPSVRPEMMRAEIPALYHQLPHIPGVEFSANSLIAATAYADWLEFDVSRFTVIPNAVPDFTEESALRNNSGDQETWDNLVKKSPECTKTVLGIFRYDDNKRPLDWVEIASHYSKKHPDTRFVIVGRGKLEDQVRSKISELDAENRVFPIGLSKAVPFWLQKADVLMHLARMEGLPNVVIEAQISGTSVLATPAGGTPELIEHMETGYLLSSSENLSHNDVYTGLETLLEDPAFNNALAQKARLDSLNRHDPDRILLLTKQLLFKNG